MNFRRKIHFELPTLSHTLSEAEAIAFREDLRVADQEVQSFFRIYYIVGLMGVAAWLVSPEVKPLGELLRGNEGYNLYVPIIIAFLNSVSTSYLLLKSIEIHEIAQFVVYASKPDSGFVFWEDWRRTKISVTRVPRILYGVFLILVPFGVSFILIVASWRLTRSQGSFSSTRIALYIVILLHSIPLLLTYFNLVEVNALWKRIRTQRYESR